MKLIKYLVLALLLIPSWVLGATYYIDYEAADDSANGTTVSTPWKRCPGMVGFAGSYSHANGDKFVFKGGVTWPYISGETILTIANSGVDGTEDIYTGGQAEETPYGSGYPMFDGGNVAALNYAVYSSAKSYFKMRYIKIQNLQSADASNQAMLLIGGTNIEVDHMYLEPNSVNAFAWAGVTGSSHTKIYFHDNIIRKSGRVTLQGNDSRTTDMRLYNNVMEGGWDFDPVSYHADGFMIGGDGTTDYAIKGLYIYNNKFWGDWHRPYTAQIYLNGTTMYCGTFTNGTTEPTANTVASPSYPYDVTNGAKIYSATLASGAWDGTGAGTACYSANLWETGNVILNAYTGATHFTMSSGGTAGALKSTQNTYIWNNLLTTSNAAGAGESGDKGIKVVAGHDTVGIYNNTIDHSSQTHGGSVCIEYYSFVSNMTVKNNICNGFLNMSLAPNATGTHVIDYNIYKTRNNRILIYSSNTATSCAAAATTFSAFFPNTKCSIADPDFATDITPADAGGAGYSVSNGDLTPSAASYAVGNGADLSAAVPFDTFGTTDINGVTRSTWDIGAIAYGQTSGDTTAPTVTSAVIQANGTDIIFGFSEQCDAADGAAFTIVPSGGAATLTCPAASNVTSLTCTISRATAIQQSETFTYGYTGVKVTDNATNALDTITASSTGVFNASTQNTPPTATLSITVVGGGSVASIPTGIDCGATCSKVYDTDTAVTLYPTTNNGWQGPTYSGDCSSNAVTMSEAKACTVTFSEIKLNTFCR
jgi:hypothetical protein